MKTLELIEKWSVDRGLHQAQPVSQISKLAEEVGELASAINKKRYSEAMDAIGDCVVVLTVLCTQLNIRIEDCIELAYDTIKDRKGKMVNGVFVKEEDLSAGKQVKSTANSLASL